MITPCRVQCGKEAGSIVAEVLGNDPRPQDHKTHTKHVYNGTGLGLQGPRFQRVLGQGIQGI